MIFHPELKTEEVYLADIYPWTDIRHMSGICPHYVRSISFFGFQLFCWKVYFESERVFFGFMER